MVLLALANALDLKMHPPMKGVGYNASGRRTAAPADQEKGRSFGDELSPSVPVSPKFAFHALSKPRGFTHDYIDSVDLMV